jgi:hypothetical protein
VALFSHFSESAIRNPDFPYDFSMSSATPQNISRLISLPDAVPPSLTEPAARGHWFAEQLESGHILFFPETPFPLAPDDRDFLLGLRQTEGKFHKNVAYRPLEDRLTGLDKREPSERQRRLGSILRKFSADVARFLDETFPDYAGRIRRDFASFRPLEEKGRPSRLRARNDLLHTDAFPTRPTHGDRILRVFTNFNPTERRVWHTSETLAGLAPRFARQAGLPRAQSRGLPASANSRPVILSAAKDLLLASSPRPARSAPARLLHEIAKLLGIPAARRSPYDRFMLRFHNFLKENQSFQETCTKQRWEFPPGSAWIVFTDMATHAVLSGQFALEQTFIVSRSAMVLPEMAPISILENLCGRTLAE